MNDTTKAHDAAVAKANAEIKMFGMEEGELVESYGPTSFNWVGCGGPMQLAGSIMSDAQELIARGETELARQFLNRAKWVLFAQIRADRSAEREGRGTRCYPGGRTIDVESKHGEWTAWAVVALQKAADADRVCPCTGTTRCAICGPDSATAEFEARR